MFGKTALFVGVAAIIFAGCSTSTETPASANNSASPLSFGLLQSLTGKWKCSGTASDSKDVASWAMTATMLGSRWIVFSGTYPDTRVEPPGPYRSIVGFDATRHKWVNIEITGSGYYMTQTSNAAATSTTQRYVEAYPIYFGDGPETIVMAKDRVAFAYSVKKKGGIVSVRDECVRTH